MAVASTAASTAAATLAERLRTPTLSTPPRLSRAHRPGLRTVRLVAELDIAFLKYKCKAGLKVGTAASYAKDNLLKNWGVTLSHSHICHKLTEASTYGEDI